MGLLPRENRRSILVAIAMVIVVVVLATLQYRWIGQLSEAQRERLQSRLDTSVEVFRESFERELMDVAGPFRWERLLAGETNEETYAGHVMEWRDTWLHPDLVASIHLGLPDGSGGIRLSRYNEEVRTFELTGSSERLAALPASCGLGSVEQMFAGSRRPVFWSLARVDGHPVLIRPLVNFPGPPDFRRDDSRSPDISGYLFLELSPDYLRGTLFPQIARLAFGGLQDSPYRLAVLDGEAGTAIFLSDPSLSGSDFEGADLREPLPGRREPGPENRHLRRGSRGYRGPGRPMIETCGGGGSIWELVVQHQEGSVESAITHFRRRNLAVSGGVLVLLIIAVMMLLSSTRRAQWLARQQMEFAAGVSHELRTPLAVIRSASDNLAEGVVTSARQVQEYGVLIRREGRRLSAMIEQALQFTSAQAGGRKYDLVAVDVVRLVDRVLHDCQPMIDEMGFTVEREFAKDLPEVRADSRALAVCLQNLVTNALKYGGDSRWMRVKAAGNGRRPPEVAISVEDHGPGITARDLPRVFEPYYQGRSKSGTKARGFGLGLSITKDTIEAMGGRISLDTDADRGSVFVLHLPVYEPGPHSSHAA